MLRVEDIHAAYGKKAVLRGVSLRLERGEVVGLIGGNGSGKSTVLKVIAGLVWPSRGHVWLGEQEITRQLPHDVQSHGISLLLQGGRVFPNLTVAENLAIGSNGRRHVKVSKRPRNLVFEKLSELWNRKAGLLSGGERQMLATEIVLAQQPRLLLLDEPSAGLAPNLVRSFLDSLFCYLEGSGGAALLVEQNIHEAMRVSSRVLHLVDGRIVDRPVGYTATQ